MHFEECILVLGVANTATSSVENKTTKEREILNNTVLTVVINVHFKHMIITKIMNLIDE